MSSEEFDRLLAMHAGTLSRIAAQYEARPIRLEDLLQEIAFAIWKALPTWRNDASIKTFIARIAHNHGVNHVIEVSTMARGGFAEKHVAGNMGAAILKQFDVTLDYADRCVYLKPNKNYGEPMNYGRTGMWVTGNKRGDFVVRHVMRGGPADAAGLKKGDRITAVNGQSAANVGADKFEAMLTRMRMQAPGTKVTLTAGEGKTAHTVTLAVRRLIPTNGGLKMAAAKSP